MTRYRVINDPQSAATCSAKELNGTVTNTVIQKPLRRQKMMYDEVIPNFHLRSKTGEIFNNTMSSTEITFDASGTYDAGTQILKGPNAGKNTRYLYTGGGVLVNMYNKGQLPFNAVSIDMTNADATSVVNCLANVNATESDALNFMAEWSKTKTLYRDILSNFYNVLVKGASYRKVFDKIEKIPVFDKSGNPKLTRKGKPVYKYIHTETGGHRGSASERTKSLADSYLSVRMGLLPLVSDLEGALKALVSSKTTRQTARDRQILTGQSTKVISVADGPGDWQVTLTTTRVITLRRGILYESTFAMRLAAQFGLTRPISSLWESLPWSFVFDWFFRVGTWLDAVQPSGSHKTLCAWVSTHDVTVQTATVNQFLTKTAPNAVSVTSGSWNETLTKVTTVKSRAPWDCTLPKLPSFGTGIHGLRSVDAFALMAQSLSSFFKR